MPVSVAIFLSCAATGAAFVGCIAAVVLAVSGRLARESRSSRRAARFAREPSMIATLILTATTAIPWVDGSAVGVRLPQTVWGLPWLRWMIALLILAGFAVAAARMAFPGGVTAVLACLVFLADTIVGAIGMTLASIAQHVSHYTFVADTLLRGVRNKSVLLPVIRVGPGSIAFMFAAALGSVLVPACGRAWGGRSSGGSPANGSPDEGSTAVAVLDEF